MRIITFLIVLGVLAFLSASSFGQEMQIGAPVVFVDDLSITRRMNKHYACKGILISIDDHFPAEYRVKVKHGILDYFYVSYRGKLIGEGRTYYYNSIARDACTIIKRHSK